MKQVTAYESNCGRLYRHKASAVCHDKKCTHFSNSAFRTCSTCKHGALISDNNGMSHDPQFYHEWATWECKNPLFDYDAHFQGIPNERYGMCINCPVFEPKTEFLGEYRKWVAKSKEYLTETP